MTNGGTVIFQDRFYCIWTSENHLVIIVKDHCNSMCRSLSNSHYNINGTHHTHWTSYCLSSNLLSITVKPVLADHCQERPPDRRTTHFWQKDLHCTSHFCGQWADGVVFEDRFYCNCITQVTSIIIVKQTPVHPHHVHVVLHLNEFMMTHVFTTMPQWRQFCPVCV